MTTFRYSRATRRRPRACRSLKIVLSGLPSETHAWNLVALQLIMEGMGHEVVNLGAGADVARVLAACRRERPDCLVLSTVTGRGQAEAARVISKVRADPALSGLTAVLGGRLGAGGDPRAELLGLGFDEVFHVDSADTGKAVASLREFVSTRAC
ncbi:cobalamin-dependent protein [Amycolatopsis sp. NPDC059027]|uniref:cobalamin-dependent protein n=1 Tax=unclassified Amycolatopsis TaxID=2618356 RepID=UPI00366CAA51